MTDLLLPVGWEHVAALPPIPGAFCPDPCGQPAVLRVRGVWRCPNHPPRPGQWGNPVHRGSVGVINFASVRPDCHCHPHGACLCGRRPPPPQEPK